MLEALEVMCSPEFNLTGVLIANKNKRNTKACWIPESCHGKMVQTQYLPNQTAFYEYSLQSRFMMLPNVYDASPRVTSQALALNLPILMNRNIVGGWKYLNEKTGEFFHDMSDFKVSLRRLLDRMDRNEYEPREYIKANYGTQKAGARLREWIETNFPSKVKFPEGSRLVIPSGV